MNTKDRKDKHKPNTEKSKSETKKRASSRPFEAE